MFGINLCFQCFCNNCSVMAIAKASMCYVWCFVRVLLYWYGPRELRTN